VSERASVQKAKAPAQAPVPLPVAASAHQAQTPGAHDSSLNLVQRKLGNFALQRALASVRMPMPAGQTLRLMTKLAIETPGDAFEAEADRIADEVMRMTEAELPRPRETSDRARRPRRKAVSSAATINVPRSVQRALASPGQALDPATRAFMEPRFNRDLSAVRIHNDTNADLAARDLGALAFAFGAHVAFRAGRYSPHSNAGRRLLAHELTHVLQQSADGAVDHQRPLRSTSARLQLTVDPETVARAPDPIDRFDGWGWWRVGPEFRGTPGVEQVTRVLIDYAGMDATRLRESTARLVEYVPDIGHYPYWCYSHPVHGVVARAMVGFSSGTGSPLVVFLLMTDEQGRRINLGDDMDSGADGVPRVTTGDPASREERTPDEEPAAAEGPVAGAEDSFARPIRADDTVMAGNADLSRLYLLLMQHFTSLNITAELTTSASDGLTAEELRAIIGEDRLRERLTMLFTQGWSEFSGAGGTDVAIFGSLMERILEQFTRGNVTAVANLLRIGHGMPERDILGIAHRNNGMLLYDELGMPMRSVVGLAWRDTGFIGRAVSEETTREGLEHGEPLTREAHVDALVANLFAQALGAHDTAMVAQAVAAAMRNLREVASRVEDGILEEVMTTVGETIGVLVLFMLGHALARLLMRSANPYAVAVGVGIEVALRGLGLVMGIDFAGDALDALMESAFHLSRVRENDAGVPTALSEMHMDMAAEPVSRLINYTAAAMTAGAFALAVRGVRGGRRGSWRGDWRSRTLALRLMLATGRGVREGIGADTLGYGSTSPTVVEVPRTGGTGTSVPEVGARGTVAPEVVAPETVAPETVTPRTVAPETIAPETVTPRTVAPETVAPETVAPDTVAPESAAGLSAPAPEVAETFGAQLVRLFLADPESFDADALTPEARRSMLAAFFADLASYLEAAETDAGDTLLTRLVEEDVAAREAAARPEGADALASPVESESTGGETAAETPAETAPAEAAPESAAGLSAPTPLDPSTSVTVNTRSGIYYPPGTRYHGRTGRNWAQMSLAEAEAQGARATALPVTRVAVPSGVYSVEHPTLGEPRIVLRALLGYRVARAGMERFMRSASEYAIDAIQGWQRAHASGAGLGAEAAEAIRLAPEFVNQALQNRGVERFLRDLRDIVLPEGAQIHVITEVTTHPGTLRLRSIEYRIEILRDGSRHTVGDVRIEVTREGISHAEVRAPGIDSYAPTPEFGPEGETGD
jgi:hypothetical protein